ncbi:MAG: peptidylprolyl isomerase [Bacteroidota bacterium]
MAIIGRIRKHSALLVILIGVALAGFVLQDFFRKGGSGSKSQLFAKIGSEKISKLDFDQKVDEQVTFYKQQSKKENLTSAENFQIMTSTWEKLLKDQIMQKEYEELGLALDHEKSTKASISPEELYDLMMGKNLHPYVVQNFGDPTTGVVDVQKIQSIIQNFDQMKDEEKQQWKRFEQGIKEDRISTKYNTLISQGYYMPKAFVTRIADESNKSAKLLCVGVKYQTISDSSVAITDADYQKYYDEHKYEFEQEKARDLDYVIFEVLPSKEDLTKIAENVNRIYQDLQKSSDSEIDNFMKANSDAPYDSNFFKKGALPVKIDSIMFASKVGTIIPPYIDNNSYVIARLMQIQDRPDSIKISHILVAYKDAPNPIKDITRTKEQAKKIVDSLFAIVKKDAKSFVPLAQLKSDYPTAKKDAGEIGWIGDGDANYKFFFDSTYNSKIGDLKIIQSSMGYHIIYVSGKKDLVKKVKVAIVKHDIKPSSETFNQYLGKASEFAGTNRTAEQFNKTVADKGLNKRSAQMVKEMDYTIPGLESARDIIRWAFDEKTVKGMVSEQVFDENGKYVVATIVEKREKGIAPLDQVKTYIETFVKREKKAEKLIEKIKSVSNSTKDIYQIALKLNTKVDTVDQLTFSASNFPKYGPEPELIGTIFTLKKNVLSEPIKGKMAVYEVILGDIVQPTTATNTDMIKMQLNSYFRSRVAGNPYYQQESDVFKAIKDKTKITDNRINYY